MTPFHVGMRVVCVDDENRGQYKTRWVPVGGLDGLRKDVVYTVRYVGICEYAGDFEVLKVAEIIRPGLRDGRFFDIGYAIQRFRPAHENRMDELRQLLAPVPSKAKRVEA